MRSVGGRSIANLETLWDQERRVSVTAECMFDLTNSDCDVRLIAGPPNHKCRVGCMWRRWVMSEIELLVSIADVVTNNLILGGTL